jgi:hypothetical protein
MHESNVYSEGERDEPSRHEWKANAQTETLMGDEQMDVAGQEVLFEQI